MANKLAYSDRDRLRFRDKLEAFPPAVLSSMGSAERHYQEMRAIEKRLSAARKDDNEAAVESLTKQRDMAEERYHGELTEVGVRAMEWVEELAERAGLTLDEATDVARAGEL